MIESAEGKPVVWMWWWFSGRMYGSVGEMMINHDCVDLVDFPLGADIFNEYKMKLIPKMCIAAPRYGIKQDSLFCEFSTLFQCHRHCLTMALK